MTTQRTRPGMSRVNFEIPDDLFERCARLPWGFRTSLMRIILERIVDSIEKNGEIMIGAILSGEFSLEYTPREGVHPADMPDGGIEDGQAQ